MQYKAVDYWNYPDSLEHYGVKGMKWGVRKTVERTGRIVRNAGGAVKRTAGRIVGGAVRVGSAVRKFKNRRAIRSGNVNRILSRSSKMSNEELQEASTRTRLISEINNNRLNRVSNKQPGLIRRTMDAQANRLASNVANAAVGAVLTGDNPRDLLLKSYGGKTASERKAAEQQAKANELSTKARIASSERLLKSYETPVKTITVSSGRKYVNRSVSSTNRYLYNVPVKNLRTGEYVSKEVRHSDISINDDFLAHYGVKGMKWGVRHDYERRLKRNEKEYVRNIDNKLKNIRRSNSKLVSDHGRKVALQEAKRFDRQAKANEKTAWKIMGEAASKGLDVEVVSRTHSAPSYNRTTWSAAIAGGVGKTATLGMAPSFTAAIPVSLVNAYYVSGVVGGSYYNKTLNKYGDTPMYMVSNKYKVRQSKERLGHIRMRQSRNPISKYNALMKKRNADIYNS